MKKQQYQGDISIIEISESELPKNLTFKVFPKEGLVVAEGETTGHKHKILAEPEALIEFAQDERGFYIKTKNQGAQIVHEEHGTQIFEPRKIFFVGRQWEYNELNDRKVQD
jgi:hypothetical protein